MNKQKEKKTGGQSRGGGFEPAMLVLGLLQATGEEDLTAPSAQERKEMRERVKDPTQPKIEDLKTVQKKLQTLKVELEALIKLFEEEVFPPLIGFWVDVNDEFGPELSLALLKWAKPNVEQAGRLFASVNKSGNQMMMYLRRTPGGIVGSQHGYWVKSEAEELIVMDDAPLKIKGKDGKEAALRLATVDEEKKEVRMRVGKNKELVSIGEGQKKSFDLDGDGREDVEVMVKKLFGGDTMMAEVKKVGGE